MRLRCSSSWKVNLKWVHPEQPNAKSRKKSDPCMTINGHSLFYRLFKGVTQSVIPEIEESRTAIWYLKTRGYSRILAAVLTEYSRTIKLLSHITL